MATTRQNCTTGRTINKCARFICTQNNLQSGYIGHSAKVYGKGVLEGPEIPTCVGLPSRKYLPVSVQVEHRPATAVSYVTRQMATGAPTRAPADAAHSGAGQLMPSHPPCGRQILARPLRHRPANVISSATWQTDIGAPARAPAGQQPSHLPRGG